MTDQVAAPTVAPRTKQKTQPEAVDPLDDPIRQQLAFDAYRILVAQQAQDGKFSEEIVGTWMWRFADSAIRGKKRLHKPSISQSGIIIGPPPEPPMPIAEPLPPLEEVT